MPGQPRHVVLGLKKVCCIAYTLGKTLLLKTGLVKSHPCILSTTLSKKLWGGYARYAVPELEALVSNTGADIYDRVAAAWALARWHYSNGAYEKMLPYIIACKEVKNFRKKQLLIGEALCLFHLGHYKAAKLFFDSLDKKDFNTTTALLLYATALRGCALQMGKPLAEAEQEQLACLNNVLRAEGLTTLALRDASQPLSLANIVSPEALKLADCPLKVSVIMPAYNAGKTIATALESLRDQTWWNLEILVVDDASQDDTAAIVQTLCEQDARIQLIRLPENGGAYPARNAALRRATGQLVIVHDSDDWSHPQKVAIEVAALQNDPQAVAVMAQWIRVSPQLEVQGSWSAASIIQPDVSSLLIRREALDAVGPWDEVCISGDTEMWHRLLARYGKKSVRKIGSPGFLAFSIARNDSLTATSKTHVRTLLAHNGVRFVYRQGFTHWHKTGLAEGLPYTHKKALIPPCVRSGEPESREYDLVVACDFAPDGPERANSLEYALAAHMQGKRVALLHWRSYDGDPCTAPHASVFDACLRQGIEMLSAADTLTTQWFFLGDAALLSHLPDAFPCIRSLRNIVLVSRWGKAYPGVKSSVEKPDVWRSNLRKALGADGVWMPVSGLVKEMMERDSRFPKPYPSAWLPLVRAASFAPPLCLEEAQGRKPVLGWLAEAGREYPSALPEALREAQGADSPVIMRLMEEKAGVGALPGAWERVPFSRDGLREHLIALDGILFLSPEECAGNERVIVEALALGKIVILPPALEGTFADAVVYSDAAGSIPTALRYWRDAAAFQAQATRARQFTAERCDWSCLAARFARLERADMEQPF